MRSAGGLESLIGAPEPKLEEAMEAEHTHGPGTESSDLFVTSNYGVRTCSNTEWLFVAEPSATPESLGLCAAALEPPSACAAAAAAQLSVGQ